MARRMRAKENRVAAPHDGPGGRRLSVSVWLRLMKCYNLVFRELRKSVEKDGRITFPQFDVLAQLSREKEGISFVDLSRRLMVTSGNLTGIVDRLEGESLVYREPDQTDRRVVWVRLTKKGKSLIEDMIPGHVKQIESMFSAVPTKSLRQLRDMLGRCRNALGERLE